MNENEMPDWREMLRRVFGEEKAQEMEDKISQGIPFSAFQQGEGVFAFPLQTVLSGSGEPVNWELARMAALGKIGSARKTVTAADAQLVRSKLSEANLRLDTVTSLRPPTADYAAWSVSKWLEESFEVWKILVTPVARSTAVSMQSALSSHVNDEDIQVEISQGPPELSQLTALFSGGAGSEAFSLKKLVEILAANLFGLQFGQAWASLAMESFGGTDIGLPIGKPDQAALVLENVERFAVDAELPLDVVVTFLATREAAYVRLYHAVPWLRMYVTKSIGDYARDIDFDLEAMEQAMRSVNPMDSQAMHEMLSKGILTPQMTGSQTYAQQSLETVLAVMEGWVDMVTTRCLSGLLPQLPSLREMMNRRRATGGPAEKAFAALIGLELRPKRLREASALWSKLVAKLGEDGAQRIWEHPDLLPEESDFDDPDGFVSRLSGEAPKDDVEVALEAILDGSLPYAEGLEPGADSDGDAKSLGAVSNSGNGDSGQRGGETNSDFEDRDDSSGSAKAD